MYERGWTRLRAEYAARASHILHVPFMAVWILQRVDDDYRAVQNHSRGRVLTGGQLVDHAEGSLGARSFAAMHGVAEPDDGGQTRSNGIEVAGRGATRI